MTPPVTSAGAALTVTALAVPVALSVLLAACCAAVGVLSRRPPTDAPPGYTDDEG